MNLNYLETFSIVVKIGSFSKAAKKLYLSQPAVSIEIMKLEQELGVCLINREKNRFAITAAGKRLYQFAECVLHEHKQLLNDLNKIGCESSEDLTIIASPVLGEFILPNVLSKFREQNPSIGIKMTITTSSQVMDEIKKGIGMVGFCVWKIEEPGLNFVKVGEDEFVLAVYPGHRFSNRSEVEASDLIGESLIFRENPIEGHPTLPKLLLKSGFDLSLHKPRFIMGTNAALISAIESKVGIAIVPYCAVKREELQGAIKIVRIKNVIRKWEMYCVYCSDSVSLSPVKQFLEFIKYLSIHMSYDGANKVVTE